MIIENPALHNKYQTFKSRRQAGFLLGSFSALEDFDILFAIPNGGLPVALGLVEFPLTPRTVIDVLIIRKIQIPGNTEAGMGAVTPDGQIFLNESLMDRLSITNLALEKQIERAKQQIEKRRREFTSAIKSQVYGKKVLIVDDGIASGFSMLAGAKWLKQLGAEITISVPTAPMSSLRNLESHVQKIICLNIRDRYPFAVADAYQNWYDLSMIEAKKYFNELHDFQPRFSDST
ncbi:MAG: phosphoribosyltransferase [Candidatus Hodarchaeales archaeon]|jgi:predicted phosphoribosyltransferase